MRIILIILLFSLIVLFHELGHFIFAKRSGIGVIEFAVGMGPKVFSIERGGTAYSFRLIPIGGFVAMEGEDGAEAEVEENSFGSKTVWQRMQTIAAGPIFNIILTVILLIPVFFYMGSPTNKIDSVMNNMPAYEVGIKAGDVIEKVNGKTVTNGTEVSEAITAAGNKEMSITLDRDGKTVEVKVTPKEQDGRNMVGIQYVMEKSVFGSIKRAFSATYQMTVRMLQFIGQLFTGNLPMKVTEAVSGPVGVISIVNDASQAGAINVVYVMAVISLNLGILNLLPIPALDGFRILMLIIELLRGGKKFNPEKEGMVNFIGFMLLIGFTIFVTYNDVLKLIK